MVRVSAAAGCALFACAGVASAGAGSIGSGSVGAPKPPKLRDAICLTQCVGLREPIVGSTVQVSGRRMSAAQWVSFRRRSGGRVLAPVVAATRTSAQVVAPRGARSGKLLVRDAYGQKSPPGKEAMLVRTRRSLRPGGPLRLADARVFPRRVLYNGVRSATLSFVVAGTQPSNTLRVDVVTRDGVVVQSFQPTGVAPHTTSSLAWNGTGFDGRPVPSGWYTFRVSRADGSPLGGASASSDAPNLGVGVFNAIFPIRGRHTYGDGIGAARAGHTHQGQDVFAACGTKLVAARGGKVQYAGYQGSAGNYVVIDVAGSGEDDVYMHLTETPLVAEGSRVRAGQKIGTVGETGNASGCHLHFEIWSAPGWYEGGTFLDPTPVLKAWDKYS